jgi:hypothetical protein
MRAALIIAAVMLTSACNSEPSFDERYAAAKKHVDANARAIDAELQAKATAAADVPGDAPGGTPVIEASEVPLTGT